MMFALQKAIYETLSGDTTLTAMAGVYNHVPEHTDFPYVVIGEGEAVDHSTKTGTAEEITLTIMVFSRGRGSKEALDIMARIKELLNQAAPSLTGYTLIYLVFTRAGITQTGTALTWTGEVQFRALVEEN